MFSDFINTLSDPRDVRGCRYEFKAFIGSLLLAELAGRCGINEKVRWLAQHRLDISRVFDTTWTRSPSFTAVRHMMQRLAEVGQQGLVAPSATGSIAID